MEEKHTLESQEPRLGLGFRITVGLLALLSGAILWLWASQEMELWKYLPAAFCFCIAGTVVLPKALAVACGYFVAASVLALSVWFIIDGFMDGENITGALRFGAVYGLPAIAFLLYRQLPGRRRP